MRFRKGKCVEHWVMKHEGKGVWVFWEGPIPAKKVKKILAEYQGEIPEDWRAVRVTYEAME